MCVLNNIDRFQLALDATMRVPRLKPQADAAEQWYSEQIQRHRLYVAENGDDLPDVKNWRWIGSPTANKSNSQSGEVPAGESSAGEDVAM